MCKSQLPRCTFYTWFARKSESQLKIADNVPKDYKLIYKTTFDNYLMGCQLLSSVLIAIVGCTILLNPNFNDVPNESSKSKARATDNEAMVYLTCFVIFVIILQQMIARIPIRIYNHSETKPYIFVLFGNLPFTKKHLVCTVNEISKMEVKGVFPWKDCRYKITKEEHDHNILLWDYYFRKPADFNILLGYQKDDDDDYKRNN